MQIVAVENNRRDLNTLKKAVQEIFPESAIECFVDPLMAIKHCMDNPPDLVFSEQDLKRLDGFALIKALQQKFPQFSGVLISENSGLQQEAENAMLGFLQKPITPENLNKWKLQFEEEEK